MVNLFRAKRRIDQGMGDMMTNLLRYPLVFNKINTKYPKCDDATQEAVMQLATHPMGDPEAQKVLEMLC